MFKNLVALIAVMITIAGCGGGESDAASPAQQTRLLAQVTQVSDTVTIHGYRANYAIAKNADGSVTLTNLVDQTSQLFPPTLQTIKFADKFVSFDSTGIPGQSYRLYQAAFNRTPDLGGLGFWTHILQGGTSLDAVAGYFYSSPEFQTLYGQVNDDQFITLLYNNVLHRVPDQGGHDFWSLQMKNGLSRQGVLSYFSESPENVGNAAPAIKNGIDYIPDAADMKVIPVQKSSYENKIAAATAIGPQPVASGDAFAFADFFQDGTYSMVTHTLVYNNQDPTTATKFGSIQFWKKVNGSWVDRTSALLTDTVACLHPRKAIVADFNGDGKPDVFFACHGFDGPPFPGERPHMLMSQADGTYKNVTLPITCYCHGASAADVNGDGYPDIAIVDQFIARTPNFLINNKDGTFTQDLTRLPISLIDRQIYSAELIDFDKIGKYDLWLAGNEPNSTQNFIPPQFTQLPTIYKNDGAGGYKSATPIVLAGDTKNGIALDINFTNGNIYLLRTSIYDASTTYNAVAIQKIAYPSLTTRTIYTHSGPYPQNANTGLSGWVNWIIPFQGNIMSLNAAYGVSVPQ